MKIIIRIYGIIIIFMIILVYNLYLFKASIIANELDKAMRIAIEQTQDMMKEVIYQRNNNIPADLNNEEYEQYFSECFNSLIKDSSIYDLRIKADAKYGILTIEAKTNNIFVKKRKLTNIVDIKLEKTRDIEEQIKINYYDDAHQDNVVFQKEFISPKTITKLNIYAISYMNSDESHYYDCSPTVEIYLDDVLFKTFDHVRKREMRTITFPEGTKVKKILIMTRALDWDYYDRTQFLIVGSSKICFISKESTYQIYNRYISNKDSLEAKSLWQKEEYQKVLKAHLE